jgi:hypothetical protein
LCQLGISAAAEKYDFQFLLSSILIHLQSPDIRVLTNILSGSCGSIKPAGSKYGLDRQILFIRQQNLLPSSVVVAVKDRDFDSDDSLPQNTPRNWSARVNNQTIQVGWSWERKEIENYLKEHDAMTINSLHYYLVRKSQFTLSSSDFRIKEEILNGLQSADSYTIKKLSINIAYHLLFYKLKENAVVLSYEDDYNFSYKKEATAKAFNAGIFCSVNLVEDDTDINQLVKDLKLIKEPIL